MSLEPGGRSDKYGNIYENRFLAKLYIRLIREEISSVTVEPLGPNSDSVEYITEHPDGSTIYYQCKAANGTNTAWSFSDLKRYNVFIRAKDIIQSPGQNKYYFISPLSYRELNELCKRSRTNNSTGEFISYQLTNPVIRAYFSDIAKEYELNTDDPDDQAKIRWILSRCYFEQIPDGTESKSDLETLISLIFTGIPSNVRLLLENYASDTDRFGQKTTATDLIEFLKNNGVNLRNFQVPKTVYQTINDLNEKYFSCYPAILGKLIHRSTTDKIIAAICSGKSVILHGKAGSGKSGCLQEFKNYLNSNQILYLCIKLDKVIPHGTDDDYGKSLGLPGSPVSCLTKLAAGKKCVLILDQLDALRWTNVHSSEALDVCKTLIKRCCAINQWENGNISIIFASRTFDLENDAGLRELFSSENSSASNWEKINVSLFSKEDLESIIGSRYNTFPPRLQELLLTPSSLYVWTQLSKTIQSQSINSVHSLMAIWWKSILRQCRQLGITEENVTNCKNRIVTYMERRSTFSLPSTLFSEYEFVINTLISIGLLSEKSNTSLISFTHQSFLDYFITADIIEKIYSGEHLVDLMYPYDDQTPSLRYRLLSILQTLIDCDPDIFVQEAFDFLESDSIRYYYKCAVFEIIGQCEQPDVKIFDFVDSYFKKEEWEKYIRQVVLLGHPQFVTTSSIFTRNDWFNEKDLALLRSVCDTVPDFVANLLEPYFSENDLEQNRKIWVTISDDANLDSNKLFALRKRLTEKEPNLLERSACLYDLIRKKSVRAVELLDILIKKWPSFSEKEVYWGDKTEIKEFAESQCGEIIKTLFPSICETTKNYCCTWPHRYFETDFSDWIEHEYNQTAVRQIVNIAKISIKTIAKMHPAQFILNVKNIGFQISSIAQEIITYGLRYVPVEFSDNIIEWLLEDFDNRIFVFSANPQDYLYDAKILIEKYTPYCQEKSFKDLERLICTWSENPAEMIHTFKSRCNRNREHAGLPVYYAYWGHIQKALLPHMDTSRLSPHAVRLLDSLNRNDWICSPHFYCGYKGGSAGTIHSPIDNRIRHISNQTWLQIVTTPDNQMGKRWCHWHENSYIEATHDAFANSFETALKLEPIRLATLALNFPNNCYDGYIIRLFDALQDKNVQSIMDYSLINKLIHKFMRRTEDNIIFSILRCIEKYSAYQWTEDVLQYISRMAQNHANPEANEYPLINDDHDQCSIEYVLGKSLNCIRGCAAYTMAALVWDHSEFLSFFKDSIVSLHHDSNAAVRLASLRAIAAYYNFDPEFAFALMDRLAQKDLRIICTHEWWQVMCLNFRTKDSYYRDLLIKGCESKNESVASKSAELLCAITIFNDDDLLYSYIINHSFTDKQQDRMYRQAVSSFGNETFHDRSSAILTYLVKSANNELTALGPLFYERSINIQKDKDFLILIMSSHQSRYLRRAFLEYLEKTDENICDFIDVLAALAASLVQETTTWDSRLLTENLVKCVIKLFDRGMHNKEIRRTCLDMWDNLFNSNLEDIRPISDKLSFV